MATATPWPSGGAARRKIPPMASTTLTPARSIPPYITSQKGSGLIMASEHWAIVGENGGTEQTNGTPAGATICQHVKAFSSKGMAHAGILISGGMDNYPYGMWNAIQISRGAFMRNGSMDGIPGTTAFKCDSWFHDLGYPDIGWHVGYCPNHIKTVGAYPFNITGDSLRIKNNTDGGNASVIINKVSGTGTAGIVLQVDDTSQNDIYVEKGNPNTFYRARQSAYFPPSFFLHGCVRYALECFIGWNCSSKSGYRWHYRKWMV